MTVERAYHQKTEMAELAALDAKGETTEEQRAYLRRPENLHLWRAALGELRADIEAQFARRKADLEELKEHCFTLPEEEGKALFREGLGDYKRWKKGASRYLASVNMCLQENKGLIQHHAQESDRRRHRLSHGLARELRGFLADEYNFATREETLLKREELLGRLEEYLED